MPTYDASAIEVLSGLEPVRKRPGMYTNTERPNHLAAEVIDNSVDEALVGHATEISVTLHQDNALSVTDNGRGIPVDLHKKENLSGVELILTKLHAGGKFSNKNYRFSGGLHGVGVSVVNALSTELEIWIKRDGKQWHMKFAGGTPTSPLTAIGEVPKRDTGTTIRFTPDQKYFAAPKFHIDRLKRNLRAKAVLCSGLRVTFQDQTNPENDQHWQYENGLRDYFRTATETATLIPEAPFAGEHKQPDGEIDWVVAWHTTEDSNTPTLGTDLIAESYVNLIPTAQGGTHVNGFRSGLSEALREFCEFRDLLPRGVKLTHEDVCNPCAYVLSVRINEPQFSGQAKDRLSSPATTPFVQTPVKDAFSNWLHRHIEEGEKIARLVIENAQRRARANKRVQRKKITSGPALPGKLADCASDDTERTELFLVEGDSAGGSAKQARDRIFQAIMPLRGKILNTWEVDPAEVLSSQEVHDIATALGVDPGSTDLTGLRYARVCILADADSDGLHIATLLCALFLRHFPALVRDGRVCIAMPPLYRIDIAKQVHYALDDAERDKILAQIQADQIRGKVNVQRFKGLGEMNPLQLRETTMHPATRRLMQLQIPNDNTATATDTNTDTATNTDTDTDTDKTTLTSLHAQMDILLAKKRAPERKQWLTQKGNQAQIN